MSGGTWRWEGWVWGLEEGGRVRTEMASGQQVKVPPMCWGKWVRIVLGHLLDKYLG
jgi:hypothetical protein